MRRRLVLAGLPAAALGLLLAWEVAATTEDGPDWAARQPAIDAVPQGAAGPVAAQPPDQYAKAVATILARPLFSPGRRPAAPRAAAPAAGQADGLPRLSGTVVGQSERHAIFVDAAGHSRSVGEGMPIGSFTVKAIEPGQVVLTSSEGSRVLHTTYSKAAPPGPAGAGPAIPAAVEAEPRR